MHTVPARPIAAIRACTAALALGAAVAGCRGDSMGTGGGDPLHAAAAEPGLPLASAGSKGMDSVRLAGLLERIGSGAYGHQTGLVVVRNGAIVAERYWNGHSVQAPHTLQSVTKSVTSLLAGIAEDRGVLELDEAVLGRFPEYPDLAHLDARKRAMRVEDLLTMRTGLDWTEYRHEPGEPLYELNHSPGDWYRFVLDWPMREQPGTRWEYNSGGVIVLGGILRAATGLRADQLADEALFRPLGITSARWAFGPDMVPHTGGGLSLRTRDMAKLGLLMLDGGRWEGAQVVSQEWIARSTATHLSRVRTMGPHRVDYGYLWWQVPLDDPMNPRPAPGSAIFAAGAGGQFIIIVPRYALVVATNAWDEAQWFRALDFLFTDILPAIDG
jgi:CubicO group peptidase (beta-lactamase class C family)